jgi:hypothetical protein
MGDARILKYVVCLILCAVISVVYAATKRSDVRSIVRDSLVMMGYICAGLVGIGAIVHLICLLK